MMLPEDEFIFDLYGDIEGFLLMVGYNGYHTNEEYLALARKDFKRYDLFIGFAILTRNMRVAYEHVCNILRDDDPEYREIEAQTGLAELLAEPEDFTEDDPFLEYSRMNDIGFGENV